MYMYMYMYAMQVSALEGEWKKVREQARAHVIQGVFRTHSVNAQMVKMCAVNRQGEGVQETHKRWAEAYCSLTTNGLGGATTIVGTVARKKRAWGVRCATVMASGRAKVRDSTRGEKHLTVGSDIEILATARRLHHTEMIATLPMCGEGIYEGSIR